MSGKRLCGFLLLLPLLVSCRTQSPADELRAELKTIASWAATARMVSEAWTSGAVPTAYARRTLQAAQETLEEEAQALNQLSNAPADKRAQALERVRRLQEAVREMQSAVESGSASALAEPLRRLSAEEEALKALNESFGGQS